jgi:hypothetical protein
VSRAFIKETDDRPEELLERRVSTHTNLVTREGLESIEEDLAAAATAQGRQSQPAMMRRSPDAWPPELVPLKPEQHRPPGRSFMIM